MKTFQGTFSDALLFVFVFVFACQLSLMKRDKFQEYFHPMLVEIRLRVQKCCGSNPIEDVTAGL